MFVDHVKQTGEDLHQLIILPLSLLFSSGTTSDSWDVNSIRVCGLSNLIYNTCVDKLPYAVLCVDSKFM